MRWMVTALTVGIWLVGPAATLAEDGSASRVAAPPPRPLPITAVQMHAIDQLCRQPQHTQAATIRASYSPETASKMTEIGVHATQAILPGTILALLIMAAPL